MRARPAFLALSLLAAGCPARDNARYCITSTDCRDPALRTCDVAAHECVSGCQQPADCPSGVCKFDGVCAAPDVEVAFVDNRGSPIPECQASVHAGTQADPVCEIQEA